MKKNIFLVPLICSILVGCGDGAKISVPDSEGGETSASSESESTSVTESAEKITDAQTGEEVVSAEKNPEVSEGKLEIINTIFSAYEENSPEKIYSLFNPEEMENITVFSKKNKSDFNEDEWNEKITKDSVLSAMSADIEEFQKYIAEWEEEKGNVEWEDTYYIVDDIDDYVQHKEMYKNFLDETGIKYDDCNIIELGKLNDENKIGEPIGFAHFIYQSEGKYWLSYAVELDYLVNSGFLDYSF